MFDLSVVIEQSDKHIPEKISEEEKHRQLVRQYDEMRQKLDEEEENLTFLDSNIKVINNKNVDLRNIVQSLRKDKAQHIHANVSKLNRELTVSIVYVEIIARYNAYLQLNISDFTLIFQ